jgi:methylated-DNA-[protein]-cysteine S-methyltransferase
MRGGNTTGYSSEPELPIGPKTVRPELVEGLSWFDKLRANGVAHPIFSPNGQFGVNYQARFATPFAVLGIRTAQGQLTGIDFLPVGTPPLSARDAFTEQVCIQLAAYLADPRFVFDLPLVLDGTPFRRRVWQALREISPGQPVSYGELALRLASAPRAVGQACGANPIPIVVPCHRVVAKSGLGGFMHQSAGGPLDIKRWLLRHEQADRRFI